MQIKAKIRFQYIHTGMIKNNRQYQMLGYGANEFWYAAAEKLVHSLWNTGITH